MEWVIDTDLDQILKQARVTFIDPDDQPALQYIELFVKDLRSSVESIRAAHSDLMKESAKSLPVLDQHLAEIRVINRQLMESLVTFF